MCASPPRSSSTSCARKTVSSITDLLIAARRTWNHPCRDGPSAWERRHPCLPPLAQIPSRQGCLRSQAEGPSLLILVAELFGSEQPRKLPFSVIHIFPVIDLELYASESRGRHPFVRTSQPPNQIFKAWIVPNQQNA